MRPEILLAIAIGFVLGIVALQIFLFTLFYREQIKKDLREKCYRPIHIRWRLSPFGSPYHVDSANFNVLYSDWDGFIHKATCIVYRPLMGNPFWGSLRVEWLTDTITGQELPEVQVDTEIIRPKLKKWDDSSDTKNSSEN